MKLFNKSLALVPVRDVKQHLVDEFKKSNELARKIKEKDRQIEGLEKKEEELNKALIVLEQYKFRHGKQQEEIDELKTKIKDLKEELKKQKEETNNSIIKMMTLQKQCDAFKKEITTLKRENTRLIKFKDNKKKKDK